LSALLSQFHELNLEKEECDAIRSSKDHRYFDVVFFQKLRSMVTACERWASGIVAYGNDQSLRSVVAEMVQGDSLGSLKKTKIGVLVAIRWYKNQIPFPFMDSAGSVIETLGKAQGGTRQVYRSGSSVRLRDYFRDCRGCGRCAPDH
jgi:hypothetical protein